MRQHKNEQPVQETTGVEDETFIVRRDYEVPFMLPRRMFSAGLDVYAFRVLAHIYTHWDRHEHGVMSTQHIAAVTGISPRRIHMALRELERRNMVERHDEPGEVSVLAPVHENEWRA